MEPYLGMIKKFTKFIEFIKEDSFFKDNFKNFEHKESWASENPFYRMKVRLKKEIVALGVEGVSPTKKVGNMLTQKIGTSLLMTQTQLLLIQEIITR